MIAYFARFLSKREGHHSIERILQVCTDKITGRDFCIFRPDIAKVGSALLEKTSFPILLLKGEF